MKSSEIEPAEWQNYDQSSLPKLLRHDTWSRQCGLSLLCGIDPKKSELFSSAAYYNLRYDELGMFAAETGADIEDASYWKIQLLADRPNTARRTWYANVDEFESACHDWDTTRDQFPFPSGTENDKPYNELIKNRMAAARALDDTTDIFKSNPDHDSTFAAHPNYFIQWAKNKNLDIPWLEWALKRGLVDLEPKEPTGPEVSPTTRIKKTPRIEAPERQKEKEREIAELRERAKQVAIKLKTDGIHPKYITVARVCKDLLKESFSSGKSFASRWRSVDGMRSYLKGEHHPGNNDEFRKAKSTRGKFNP